MTTAFKLMMVLSTIIAIGGFIGAFAAHILLQFYIDHDRVKEETGEPGWKTFGCVSAPIEFYKKQARVVWKIQRVGYKTFAVSLGAMLVLFLLAAILQISLA